MVLTPLVFLILFSRLPQEKGLQVSASGDAPEVIHLEQEFSCLDSDQPLAVVSPADTVLSWRDELWSKKWRELGTRDSTKDWLFGMCF